MSSPRAVLLAALDTVDAGGFDYLLYGGLAAALWGDPRYTEDVDFVLFLPERHAYKFLREAAKHGFSVEEDLAIQQIQVSGWARLPFGGQKSPWHLDLTLGDSPFDKSALARKKREELFGRKVWVASPEDLLIYKLVSWRDRDVMDVHAIIQRQKSLDQTYLRKWIGWWEKQGIAGVEERYSGLSLGK
ncbi:MAG TPA: nucleotidyl transferase AbiEii/AbiGii toxin family protein [Planctomycetota bacterium]|nr:nucleotidyl transferase AbiEii/AbiGii toxin family protein [Planctomycetota bacterium]